MFQFGSEIYSEHERHQGNLAINLCEGFIFYP